jgi:hypothetical protein
VVLMSLPTTTVEPPREGSLQFLLTVLASFKLLGSLLMLH